MHEFDRLIVVAAHPDDETLGAGGVIVRFASSGRGVTIVIASDGEASHPQSPTTTAEELAQIRRDEGSAAVATLAPAAHLLQLALPDGRIAGHTEMLTDVIRTELHGATERILLLAPWPEDGHPDHTAAGASAVTAAAEAGARVTVWGYPIWAWHWGDPAAQWPPAFAVRLSNGERESKSRAAACYRSQIAPLSPDPLDDALLQPDFLAHFERELELFFPLPASMTDSAAATG